ncbi:MAG: hypothetical protein A3B99_04950 [Candidatus Yanofskybacteria bacterium RIFCSPHIGHO2_02_FULL_44_12b]|nr:MAG: hypothetical protein A2659_03680 [Candidatus Yanofskybacteria bacterium RIFCSPHIGHO2_01_FULL_44_24]OGN16198.1 MAG: hypothetical protein A3B99_04950 [Candidatus Yanofskybacteria bacterium RIFCSPHIGHO2_02_FULL_44_12b]
MIRQTNLRDNGQGMKRDIGGCRRPLMAALESMVVYELGYGGSVTDLSETKVVVETVVLGCKDATIFEGSREEMELIVRVAACHAVIMGDETSRGAIIERVADFLGTLPSDVGGSPLYISLMAPFLIGGPSTSAALLLGLGITDPVVINTLMPISLKDLMAAVQLHKETDIPLPEIVREMGLAKG